MFLVFCNSQEAGKFYFIYLKQIDREDGTFGSVRFDYISSYDFSNGTASKDVEVVSLPILGFTASDNKEPDTIVLYCHLSGELRRIIVKYHHYSALPNETDAKLLLQQQQAELANQSIAQKKEIPSLTPTKKKAVEVKKEQQQPQQQQQQQAKAQTNGKPQRLSQESQQQNTNNVKEGTTNSQQQVQQRQTQPQVPQQLQQQQQQQNQKRAAREEKKKGLQQQQQNTPPTTTPNTTLTTTPVKPSSSKPSFQLQQQQFTAAVTPSSSQPQQPQQPQQQQSQQSQQQNQQQQPQLVPLFFKGEVSIPSFPVFTNPSPLAYKPACSYNDFIANGNINGTNHSNNDPEMADLQSVIDKQLYSNYCANSLLLHQSQEQSYQKLQQLLSYTQSLKSSSEMNMIKTLSQIVVPTVSAMIVKESEDRMKNIYAQLPNIIDNAVRISIESQTKETLVPVIKQSINNQFSNDLLVAHDNASREMFLELSDMFDSSLKNFFTTLPQTLASVNPSNNNESLSVLSTTVNTLEKITEELTNSIFETQALVNSELSNSQAQRVQVENNSNSVVRTNKDSAASPFPSLKQKIEQLLTIQHYENAFALTLQSLDPDLISWLLSIVKPSDVDDSTVFTQTIVLSLLLYFSQNFDQNLGLSLDWLSYLLTQWFQSDQVQSQDTVVFVIESLHNSLTEVNHPSYAATAKILSLSTKKFLSRMKR
jgi:hypothetical protein